MSETTQPDEAALRALAERRIAIDNDPGQFDLEEVTEAEDQLSVGTAQVVLATLADLRARLAAVEGERDNWQEDARRNMENAIYWQSRAEAAEQQLAEARAALVKVRAHTSYTAPGEPVLLRGLLASIERIADAALPALAPRAACPAGQEGACATCAAQAAQSACE